MNGQRWFVFVFLAACAAPVAGGDPRPDDGPEDSFSSCEGDSDAHAVFNDFWKTLESGYAVFDKRLGTQSWSAIGAAACADVGAEISDDALFDLLLSMAQNLDDTHITLTADELGREEDAEVSLYPHSDLVSELEDLVENNYLDANYARGADDEISWGTIGDVGFISITSMDELSPAGDDEDLDVEAAAEAMERALSDLSGTAGVVVDVRANGGGWDAVSLEIAAWFGGAETLAWSKQWRDGPEYDDFTAAHDVFVDATRAGGYSGPVVLLTSGDTVSAAETFALAMRVRDQVTILGEPTSGHFSDMTDGELANGWEFTYSGERYIAADGMIYEGAGLPPDVAMTIDESAIIAGRDPMLEAALAQLR